LQLALQPGHVLTQGHHLGGRLRRTRPSRRPIFQACQRPLQQRLAQVPETRLADAQALARFLNAAGARHRFQDDPQALLGLARSVQVFHLSRAGF